MSERAKDGVFCKVTLDPGLYFVATPIGAARDITLRALDILASADAIAAEDTRTTRRLMEIHGVPLGGRPVIAYHDHNGAARRPALLARLAAGESLAYASEAGTPLVADPGYQLGRVAREAGHRVYTAPGPSAALAALTVSGLPSDRFQFLGFAPPKGANRRAFFEAVAESPGTSITFEAPSRVRETLGELVQLCGGERPAALCRELTKKFEEVRSGPLSELLASVIQTPPKGECVLVIGRREATTATQAEVDNALLLALQHQPVKGAAAEVAEQFGLARRDAYQRALRLKSAPDGGEQ